ncbi:nucleotide exchange factor GrpE [Tomitella fengzijianii]|uniref:Protein GrpE n=1 Tax=Tomitella fengzijianii TaxID=2597660 RepID=A0A516X5V8_9ACTN|nr:nucleotide exchange factor GrpE [Tomitella fengzijianii]QDQ98462.1 nucleotide exchange factor GrpE [Tomitella fengzijianii]
MTQAPQGDGGRAASDGREEPVVVTDNRKVDPETGQARTPDSAAQAEPGAADGIELDPEAVDGEIDGAALQVAELTNDLQRLHAEYANYRKREQRERQVAVAQAKASVIGELLDLLDDLDRARDHGDLDSGPLKAIGDKLVGTLTGLGLEGFGVAGDPFDPEMHEAVQHTGGDDNPVLDTVLRRGYRVGDRVLRTAMVIVGDAPADSAGEDGGPPAAGPAGTAPGEPPAQ